MTGWAGAGRLRRVLGMESDMRKTGSGKLAARSGGRLIADALVAQGIEQVFAVPGESYLDVLDGLYAVRQRLA